MALKRFNFFGGASNMINNSIFSIFSFLTFSFGNFLDLVFRAIFFEFGQNTWFLKYPKENVKKLKMLKMLSFIICEPPQENSTNFKAIFGHFYPNSLEKLAISPKTRIRQFGQNQILTHTGK